MTVSRTIDAKQFCVSWRWNDREETVKQTMHKCRDVAEAINKSRSQMYGMRYNVSWMVPSVKEIPIDGAAKPAVKPKRKISTEVDKQGDFWWNKM